MAKRFRSGTFVRWQVGRSGQAYGVVRHKLRTRYSVLALTGTDSNGVNWAIPPECLTAISPSRVPEEVVKAMAVYALIGKAPHGE